MTFKILNELFLYLTIVVQKLGERGSHAFAVSVQEFKVSGFRRWRTPEVQAVEKPGHLLTCFFFFCVKGEAPILSKKLRSLLAALSMNIFIFL